MGKFFKIVKDSAKTIREKSEEVNPITEDTINLVNQMTEYLIASQDEEISKKYNLRPGVGLAAPQIGKNIKVLAVYFKEKQEDGTEKTIDHRLINPKIVSESVKECYLSGGEGCLSVDKSYEGYIYRKYKIIVKAFNAIKGKEEHITARGYEAIVLQHEIDHLNGVLFYDHINKKDPFEVKPDSIRL